jgi:hypothetical protein
MITRTPPQGRTTPNYRSHATAIPYSMDATHPVLFRRIGLHRTRSATLAGSPATNPRGPSLVPLFAVFGPTFSLT